jgi:hypothetical protein
VKLENNIKKLVDEKGDNPHMISKATGLTYRIVLKLYSSEEIPTTTPIGTLLAIAEYLGVGVDSLYHKA